MVKPELYSESNSLTITAAIQSLEEYAAKLKWKESGETIIDLGCGEGSVTCILKQYVPKNYEKFFACDINEKAIEYAKEHHADENIIFRTLDIVGDIPDELKCEFSHVFSFFLLHWIHDQEKAFKNIFNLMSPGGECLFIIAGFNPVTYFFDVYAQDKNFSAVRGHHKSVPTRYMYMEDVDKYLNNLMKSIGFTSIDVQLIKRTFNFKNIATLKHFIKAVDPHGIPDEIFDTSFLNYIAKGVDKGIFDEKVINMNDLKTEVRFDYDMYIVQAGKPNK